MLDGYFHLVDLTTYSQDLFGPMLDAVVIATLHRWRPANTKM